MLLTLLFLIFGWLTAIPFVVELSRVSGLLTAVTITAFVGSFIYAFAELGNNEAWQKAILLHAPEFMLGLYIPVAWHEAQSAGILILAAAGVVHVAIWKASVHSRGFRTRILQISKLMEEKENWQKLYFVLNIRGYCNVTDEIVKALGEGREILLDDMRNVLADVREDLIAGVAKELKEVQAKMYKEPQGVR